MFWIILIIAWLVSPIVFFVLFMVQLSGNKELKRKNSALSEENQRLKEKLNAAGTGSKSAESTAEAQQTEMPVAEAVTEPVKAAETAAPPSAEPVKAEETSATAAAEPAKVQDHAEKAYNMPYYTGASAEKNTAEPAASAVSAASAVPVTEKKHRISSINVLLVLGAMFIIIAGLIFATTSWKILSNGIKAVVLFSFSALFFGVSSLAERKFSLKRTGALFYTLGSVFLPITLVAAGYFKVFGEWFSLSGEGQPLLLAIAFASLSAVCLKGCTDYKSPVFAWANLVSFSAAVCSLILQFTDRADVFAAAASVYGLAVIFLCPMLSKCTSEKFAPLLSQLNVFAAVNTVLLSVSALVSAADDGNGTVVLISCVIFASAYIKMSFLETPLSNENGFSGVIPFVIFISCGALAMLSPDDFSGVAYALAAVSAVPAVMSMLNCFPVKLKSAFRAVSGAFAAIVLALCAIAAFAAEPTWVSLCAYGVLTAEILVLALFHRGEKSGKFMLSVFPAACAITAAVLSRLVTDGKTDCDFYAALIFTAIVFVIQAAFVLIPKMKVRTAASDYIFAACAVVAGIVLLGDYEVSEWLTICGCGLGAMTAAVPAFRNESNVNRSILAAGAMLWSGFAVIPAAGLLIENADNAIIAEMIVAAVLTAVSLAVTFMGRDDTLDVSVAAALRIVIGFFTAVQLFDAETVFPLFILLSAVSLVRFAKKKSRAELVSGILLFIAAAGAAAYDLIDSAELEDVWLVMGGTAAVINAGLLFFGGKEDFGQLAEKTSRYALVVLTSIAMTILISSGEFDAPYIAASAVLFLYTSASFYCSGSTGALIIPFLLLYPAVACQLEHALFDRGYYTYGSEGFYPDFNILNLSILGIIVVSAALSYVLHRNALWEKRDGRLYIDQLAFSRFFGIIAYFESCPYYYKDGSRWCGIFVIALCLLTLCRKNQKDGFKRWIYTISAFAPVIAFISQPFFEMPEVISLEMKIAPVLLYLTAIRLIWKNRTEVLDKITFIAYIASYVILFFGALDSGKIADGLIIMITALAMLVFSFCVKKKKWFVLSVAVLASTALFMSRSFWASLAWWVYLLAAGLLLIAIGAANELKKQSADKNSAFKEKLTRFMSEWTW